MDTSMFINSFWSNLSFWFGGLFGVGVSAFLINTWINMKNKGLMRRILQTLEENHKVLKKIEVSLNNG